ncbi:MAG: hypothetical protein ABIC68_03125 [Candidatus Omnitrophota bacterium]
MFKHGFKVCVVVFSYFCCMPLLDVCAQGKVDTVTFPPTGISEESQAVSAEDNAVGQSKKKEPQVLVAGSSSMPGVKSVAQESEVKAQRTQVSTEEKVAQPQQPQGQGVVTEDVVMGQGTPVVAQQAIEPAVVSKDPAQPIETNEKVQTKGEINKIVVSEPQDQVTQWVWGEVVSIDPEKKQITVKYLDYESYDEAVMTLDTDSTSVFDNMSGFSDIKPADYVTVDYYKKDDSNLATLIVVEKKDVDNDKIDADLLKQEKQAVISSGGLAAAKAELDEDVASSEELDMDVQAALDQDLGDSSLDSLDDVSIPLAPADPQSDIEPSESTPVEYINAPEE